MRRLKPNQLANVVHIAAPAEMKAEVDEALVALAKSKRLRPQTGLSAAIMATGVGSDERIAELLKASAGPRGMSVAARYHYARAMERLGREDEALGQYAKVVAEDQSETRYYAMWARQRTRYVQRIRSGESERPAAKANRVAASGTGRTVVAASGKSTNMQAGAPSALGNTADKAKRSPLEWRYQSEESQAALDAMASQLDGVASRHGAVYPWIARAADLMRMGERSAAADELHEVYLAWRGARGKPLHQTGLEAVYRGTSRSKHYVTWKVRRQRRELDSPGLQVLAEASRLLGDAGTAVGFAGKNWLDKRPRAYTELVEQAAEKFGVDPNLLLAVMRVESVYHHRIVSYAGAVGLMQIMPGTGRRIAYHLGEHDFATTELLDPGTNLSYAAWYLASLIKRFDGRVPLAVAAYNGGPHNVRQWMRENGRRMPMDAFLERIPFTQTHRYVRRVLTHYAAYRAQKELPMEELSTELPKAERDGIAF